MEKLLTVSVAAYNGAATLQKALESCLVADEVTPKGELIVDTWESRKLVSSGEVSVRGIYGYV